MFHLWENYGKPFDLPESVDFAWYSNEDIGFVANLVTGTNDTYEYSLPYPSSVDLFEETIVLYMSDFMLGTESLVDIDDGEILGRLAVFASMLQIEFAATFQGGFVDAEDEALKSKFAGPFSFGTFARDTSHGTVGNVVSRTVYGNVQKSVHQYMPTRGGLDLIVPLNYTLVNQAVSQAEATGIEAATNFTDYESTAQRIWFRKRNLTRDEKMFRNKAVRFMILDS